MCLTAIAVVVELGNISPIMASGIPICIDC